MDDTVEVPTDPHTYKGRTYYIYPCGYDEVSPLDSYCAGCGKKIVFVDA